MVADAAEGDTGSGQAPGARWRRLASTDWKAKARGVAGSLRAEYEAGRRGDDAPTTPIWATPQQQLDSMLDAMRTTAARLGVAPLGGAADGAPAQAADGGAADDEQAPGDAAEHVVDAM